MLNPKGREYGNALLSAVSQGSIPVIQQLLDAGANITASEGQHGSPLQAAVLWGKKMEVITLLLDRGADVNARYPGGYSFSTALQRAAHRGKLEMVRLLPDHGADPNIGGGKYDSAVEAAQGHETVKILLKARGANEVLRRQQNSILIETTEIECRIVSSQRLLETYHIELLILFSLVDVGHLGGFQMSSF